MMTYSGDVIEEGLTNNTFLTKSPKNFTYKRFNGNNSFIKIPFERKLRGLTSKSPYSFCTNESSSTTG